MISISDCSLISRVEYCLAGLPSVDDLWQVKVGGGGNSFSVESQKLSTCSLGSGGGVGDSAFSFTFSSL